jgi:hypothetical protein
MSVPIFKDNAFVISILSSLSFKPTKEQIQLLTSFLNDYYPNKSLCEK